MQGLSVSIAELIVLAKAAQGLGYSRHQHPLRSGLHQTKIRGRGIDFVEARNYQAGDDIRHMEWRVTARTGRPHVKVYQAERERPVLLLVDFNPSMFFGSRIAYKSVVASHLAALIAWSAAQQGDKVGGLIFSADKHQELIPKGRQAGVLPLLAHLSAYSQGVNNQPPENPNSFNQALKRAQYLAKHGTTLAIISDFYQIDEQSERLLKLISAHNDVIAYQISDPLELSPPEPGLYGISDGQTDLWLDTRKEASRQSDQAYCDSRDQQIQSLCQRARVHYHQLTAATALGPLLRQSFSPFLRA